MTDLRAPRPWWNRRDFLKSSAAVAAGVYSMRWGVAAAADIPLEFDGSKFQLKAAEPNPKHGGVIRMGIPVRPPHFDLHQSGTIFNLGAMGCMFDNLIRRDPRDGGKTIIPDLAHSWQIAKDGKTYTFFLRQGVQFSDGAELTADDVKATFDRIAKPPQGISIPRSILLRSTRATNTLSNSNYRKPAMNLSSRAQNTEALRLVEMAIAREPRYGPALAWAAVCCFRLLVDGRSEDPAAARLKGADFARRALGVAGDDPGILANAAFALAYFGEDIGAMMALVDRALALNPNYARGWLLSGALRLWAGQPDIAIEHLETALRLSPRARVGSSMSVIGGAHFYARRFDEALPKLLLAAQDDPSYPLPYRTLAACYAHMGRLEDAREIVTRLRAITSVVIPDASYLRNAEHREFYLSGLRLAAGETT